VYICLVLTSALAGPMPMFGRAPAPVAPVAVTGSVVVVPVAVPDTTVVPTTEESETEAFPARLRFVEAEPVKRKVANPGRPTPIEELPSAFRPIPQAVNRLPAPVATLRPVKEE